MHAISDGDAKTIVVLLGLAVLLGMQETLFQAAFRCVGKYRWGPWPRAWWCWRRFEHHGWGWAAPLSRACC